MLKTNRDQLVQTAVQGQISHPGASGWRVTHQGEGIILPGVGGITYNLKVGDSAFGWVADHAEPCLSTVASVSDRTGGLNHSYNYFACLGNEVVVLSGAAKGSRGIVTGTHGGCEHVMIDVADEALELMTHDDKLQIRAWGQGLQLTDFPEVKIWSLSPELLDKMQIVPEGDALKIPVAAKIPAQLLGSGLGRTDGYKADVDFQTSDRAFIESLGLHELKLGDVVAIMDYKSYYGWSYQQGAITIGVICHTDSFTAGHGPGITTLITSLNGEFQPYIDTQANIGRYLSVGRYR